MKELGRYREAYDCTTDSLLISRLVKRPGFTTEYMWLIAWSAWVDFNTFGLWNVIIVGQTWSKSSGVNSSCHVRYFDVVNQLRVDVEYKDGRWCALDALAEAELYFLLNKCLQDKHVNELAQELAVHLGLKKHNSTGVRETTLL